MRAIRVCERVRFLWHTAARIHRCHRPIRTGRSTERTLENCNRDDTRRNETTRTNETRHDTTRSDEATKQRSLFADAIREIKSQLCGRCESADRDDSGMLPCSESGSPEDRFVSISPSFPDVLPCHSKLPKDTVYTVEKLQGEPTEFPLASVYRFRDKHSLYSAQKFRRVT